MSVSAVSTGIYWDQPTWDLARSAYIADLDGDPDSPDSWIGWLHRDLGAYVARTPQERADLASTSSPDRDSAHRTRGFNRSHPFPESMIEGMETAIVEDRRQQGRTLSRSQFFREAVQLAAKDARVRLGRDLPPPPSGRLPTRPPRRPDTRRR